MLKFKIMGLTKKERERLLLKFKEDAEKRKKEDIKREQEMWENLKHFLGPGGFVPPLPRNFTEYHINKLLDCGAIDKKNLEDGVWYFGDYRNAKFGRWDAEKEKFYHRNYTMGGFRWDECNHFMDDDGAALFVPIRKATENEIKKELTKE